MGGKYYLGMDLGSVSLVVVVIDGAKKVRWHSYQKVRGRSRDAVASCCGELLAKWMAPQKVRSFSGAMATGSGKEIIQEMLGVPAVNEIVAHGTAASGFAGGRASVIEIGGQDSKFILVDDKGAYDYAMNELCAAGTGAFLDVQAERLGLSIEELSAMAAEAEVVPPMAGRCSVFAKSDIIHFQQRGIPTDRIVAGLCYALARNYVATLIRGREVVKPVVFQGGVALNDGVLRAFKALLRLADQDVLRPEMPHLAGSMGAALLSAKSPSGLDAAAIEKIAAQPRAGIGGENISLRGRRMDAEALRRMTALESCEISENPRPGEKVVLGLDIGSISTKAAVLSVAGSLKAKVYTLTSGKPLAAARRALSLLSGVLDKADIAAVGVTGSGRKLVGHAIGADLVIDEITAQAKGAGFGCEKADTVIEIGGQDAKFIRLGGNDAVVDFEMNRVCSAGTGSFLQEQAARLGIDLKHEYSKLALTALNPLPFVSRCTVFMESDLVHHVQQGVSLPDLLMGVASAVVENYLDRVVQGKKLGKQVVLQGGVALNRSVVKAFKTKLMDSTVTVHPHPGVSGAIGMARLTLERYHKGIDGRPFFTTSFKGINFSTKYGSSSIDCRGCENRCNVCVYHFKDGRFHFGDLCGRYSDAISGLEPGADMTEVMAELFNDQPGLENPIAQLGIPQALLFQEFHPFWKKYFFELNIQCVTSGPSDNVKLSLALSRLPAETCLPVKLLFGHVAFLEKEGVDTVFIPSMSRMLDGVSCPYIQHGAAMVQSNFETMNVITFPLAPGMSGREKERLVLEMAELFGVDKQKAANAYEAASEEYILFGQKSRYPGPGKQKRPLAVLLGKPYNIKDRFINMSLASKLAKAGFDVILDVQLNVPGELRLPDRYNGITWAFSRRMLKTGIWISNIDDIYPVVVGNFGCGPDSFAFPLLQEIFGDRPSLFLEFDEHRADAGLATRVEAFAHRVADWRAKKRGETNTGRHGHPDSTRKTQAADAPAIDKGTEYIIPYFSDHAYAFAGAIAAKGVKARVLPLPDYSSYEAGVEFSGGKQCHPFQLIAGDLVNLARSGDLPKGARYLLPTTKTSCLVTQYVPTMQSYMDRMGRSDIKVINVNSVELLHDFGPMFVFNLGKAILAIEYLSRLRFEMRPYESEKGAVDTAYFKALDTLYQRQQEDRTNQGIMEAAMLLDAVPTSARGTKPVIAITGDIYTRINQAANGGLFDLLEGLGCEVWQSPTLVDLIMTGQEICTRQYWEEGKPLDMMSSWGRVLVNNFGAGFVIKNFKGKLVNLTEPRAEEVLKYTDGLLPGEPELLVTLNVAKHVDFANKGVDGILNVYCLNCLVGTATTSIFKRLAKRTFGVPMMPLVFDAVGKTHIRNRVEAFVHRVLRNREEKLAAGKVFATSAEGFSNTGNATFLKELFDRKFFDVRIPNVKFPEIKIPDLRLPAVKIPHMRLPEGLLNRKKKKEPTNN